jgi:hypothetical protein
MSLYLQFEWCYVFVPSVWVVLCLCTFSLGGDKDIPPPKLKVHRHNTTHTEGTKTYHHPNWRYKDITPLKLKVQRHNTSHAESLGGGMSLYLQHEWCYVFVPSVCVVLCLCTFSLGGVMSLYLQFGLCYVFVPPLKLKVQRHNTTHAEGTKKYHHPCWRYKDITPPKLKVQRQNTTQTEGTKT